MSGDSSALAVDVGSNIYGALQASGKRQAQAAAARQSAEAQAAVAAHGILGAAAGQMGALQRQAQAAEFQAGQIEERAKLVRARTALRMAQEGREGRRRQGKRRAALAGRGITRRGSPTELLADAAAEEALSLAIVEFEGQSQSDILKQGAALKRFEAEQRRRQAGVVGHIAQQRASFIRDNATFGLSSPEGVSAGDLAITAGISALPSFTDDIANWIADGPDGSSSSFSPGVDLVPRDMGAQPRRRSLISPMRLP